jgi:hypothetical protein
MTGGKKYTWQTKQFWTNHILCDREETREAGQNARNSSETRNARTRERWAEPIVAERVRGVLSASLKAAYSTPAPVTLKKKKKGHRRTAVDVRVGSGRGLPHPIPRWRELRTIRFIWPHTSGKFERFPSGRPHDAKPLRRQASFAMRIHRWVIRALFRIR